MEEGPSFIIADKIPVVTKRKKRIKKCLHSQPVLKTKKAPLCGSPRKINSIKEKERVLSTCVAYCFPIPHSLEETGKEDVGGEEEEEMKEEEKEELEGKGGGGGG